MRTRTWCAAAALLWLPRVAAAQIVLSEADALARLDADSPRVRAIRSAVDVARAEGLAAARWPNPRFTFNRESVAGITESMFLVTQPLPVTGRRDLEVSAASTLVVASQQRVDEQIRQVRAALRRAFADLVAAQARESEVAASRDRLRGLADILARREAAGDAAGYDRLRAEREVIDIEADLTAARVDRARSQAALAAFFSPSAAAPALVATPATSFPAFLPGVEELIAHAEKHLPELAALRQEVEAARFALQAASRRPIPEPEVVAGTKTSNAAGGDVGGVFGIHLTLPVFDRAKPEHAVAEARRAQAEARIEAFQAELRANVTALLAIVIERRQAADRYRASTATSAADLERIAQVSYDAGESGILELVDAYRNSSAARLRQAGMDAEVRQAEIELELASGWEIR
jgi:outer membrane protein, heavy metal efflux system